MQDTPQKRIKVLIVINDFLIGGAQKLIVDILSRIDKTRFEPVLLTLFKFGKESGDYLYDKLPPDTELHTLNFTGVRDISSWRAFYQVLRIVNPDIVFSNLFFSNTVVRILKPFFAYQVFAAEHNTYVGKRRFERILDRILSLVTERIVAVSNTVAVFTAKQEGISPKKFVVINNGIDINALRTFMNSFDANETRKEFGFAPEDRIILNVSRIVPQKNHKLLLDGFSLFLKSHPDYRLLLVGGGSHEQKMRVYAAQIGLSETVRFLGYRKDPARFCGIADFFVSTSLIEGFGIAHAEALACGLPVLSTFTAGPDEMIKEGVNGSFIRTYTPEAVAEGLAFMAACDLAPMRVAAARSAEAYSIERAVAAYEALFSEVEHSQSH